MFFTLPCSSIVKAKASTLIELKEAVKFYQERPTSYDEKAQATLAKGKENLPAVITALEGLSAWDAALIKATITQVAEENGKKLGEVMPPMRAAIVGAMSGPDIPDAIAILGKDEAIARLKAAA